MKKNTLSFLILISGVLISGAIISFAYAQTTTSGDIQYPIAGLDNCQNKNDCKNFCDDPKNSDVCFAFAKQHNLMTPEEISNAKKFQGAGMVGPGGCKGQTACEQYCGDPAHLEECTAFAEKNGIMSDQQLQDSKKVIAAIKSGLKPPACAGPTKCNAYCSNPAHMEECMTFSIAAGIVPDSQKAQMQKTLDALKQGVKPPACQPNPPSDQLGQSEQTNQFDNGLPKCDEYCGTHQEECMTFSLAAGMVPDNQKAQAQKMLDALKQGINPPACKPNPSPNQQGNPPPQNQADQNLEPCDQYCAEDAHVQECVKFSVAMGNMTQEQGQSSIKNGGKGPGGCIGKDACNTFCNDPANQETCFNFGKDNGMIPEADLQKMQDGQQKMKDSFSQIPPEVLDCLTSSVGADVVSKMKNGEFVPQSAGDAINQCFQKFAPQDAPQNNQNPSNQPGQPRQMQPGKNQSGEHGQPNQRGENFQPRPGNINPGGEQMPQQAGPGDCKGPEECKTYCESHQDECKNFRPPQNRPDQPDQSNQPEQMQPQQQQQFQFNQGSQPGQMQPGQPNQPEQPEQFNQFNQPYQLNQTNQPGQMQPQQQQFQPQPMQQQNTPPPSSPSSFLQGAQKLLANVLNAF